MNFHFDNENNLPVVNEIKAGQKFTGLFLQKYANGEMKTFAVFKDGLMDGTFFTGHKNGQIASTGQCQKDYRIGIYQEFRDNGKLQKQVRYPADITDFVLGIPYLEKKSFNEKEEIAEHIVYTKPCWEK